MGGANATVRVDGRTSRGARDARQAGVAVTDDAALLERIGIEVVTVAPTAENFKVTIRNDVARAESILLRRPCALSS